MAPRDEIDAAFGCMLGAFCGDAAGGVLEFNDRNNNPETVEKALGMPGGGIWGLGPGQITDDSELSLALASGLSQADPQEGFPAEAVAHSYSAWLDSHPFDVGNTCRTAFSAGMHYDAQKQGPLANVMRHNALFSKDSQANGALMRITPLAVWGCRLPDEQLAAAAASDCVLSHPHVVAQHCNAAYVIAIKHLINHPGDADGAIAAAQAWAQAAPACPEVAGWLEEALGTKAGPPCNRLIGHVRYGFFYAVRHLKLRTPYRDAMREMLLLKGDVDTNAAIVGGLLGALHGAAAIPPAMAAAVLARHGQPESKGRKRPDWLQPGRLPAVFAQLWLRATGQVVELAALAGVPEAEEVEKREKEAAVVVAGEAVAVAGEAGEVAGLGDGMAA